MISRLRLLPLLALSLPAAADTQMAKDLHCDYHGCTLKCASNIHQDTLKRIEITPLENGTWMFRTTTWDEKVALIYTHTKMQTCMVEGEFSERQVVKPTTKTPECDTSDRDAQAPEWRNGQCFGNRSCQKQ